MEEAYCQSVISLGIVYKEYLLFTLVRTLFINLLLRTVMLKDTIKIVFAFIEVFCIVMDFHLVAIIL